MRTRIELPEAELVRRYTEGESMQGLSLAYGCSPATINVRLHKLGVAVRPSRYRPVSIAREEFERLYVHERLPLRQIAERLGVAPSTLGNKRRAFGIPPRSTRGRRPKAVEEQRRRAARLPLWRG